MRVTTAAERLYAFMHAFERNCNIVVDSVAPTHERECQLLEVATINADGGGQMSLVYAFTSIMTTVNPQKKQ